MGAGSSSLAASSIACLLADFYGLCPMRIFTPFIFLPATIALVAIAFVDRQRGDRQLWRAVMIGLWLGACWQPSLMTSSVCLSCSLSSGAFASVVPPMNLFKVFPRFGAMVLGQPIEQTHYSTATQLVGWLYHFSNGATFGVMYMALIGDGVRRHWLWAVLFAVGLELGHAADAVHASVCDRTYRQVCDCYSSGPRDFWSWPWADGETVGGHPSMNR